MSDNISTNLEFASPHRILLIDAVKQPASSLNRNPLLMTRTETF